MIIKNLKCLKCGAHEIIADEVISWAQAKEIESPKMIICDACNADEIDFDNPYHTE